MGLKTFSAPDMREWQLQRLRDLLRHARRSVHYRKLLESFDPEDLRSLDDLARLPFTQAAELYADPADFLCVPGSEVAKITTLSTSGTSGERKRIAFTQCDLERTVAFFHSGMQNLVHPGQRCLILMPGTAEFSIGRLLQLALSQAGIDSKIGQTDWDIDHLKDAAARADCIVGIPGELIWLCRLCPDLQPLTVLLSADYIPESVASALESSWKTRVFHHYGLTETGYGGAVHCAHRFGQHIRDAELLVEIIDPLSSVTLPPGERGEIVLTTLQNEAMPLIRYRTGDIGSLTDAPCPCGGKMPRLGRVEGRLQNNIPLDKDSYISIHYLDEILFSLPQVRSFSAALDSLAPLPRLTLTLDSCAPVDPQILKTALPDRLTLHLEYTSLNPVQNRAKRSITVRIREKGLKGLKENKGHKGHKGQ